MKNTIDLKRFNFIAACLTFILYCTPAVAQTELPYSVIGAEEMKGLYDSGTAFKLLDVQTMQEHIEWGFPPRCMCVPLRLQDQVTKEWSDNSRFIKTVEGRLGKNDKIIILCDSGVRSHDAARLMVDAGFTDVIVYRYGIHGEETSDGKFNPGWIDSGLPFVWGTMNK